MIRCAGCNGLTKPGEKPVRLVTETRSKTYPRREQAMRRGRGLTLRWIPDPGGVGTEIVKEEFFHEVCSYDFYTGSGIGVTT